MVHKHAVELEFKLGKIFSQYSNSKESLTIGRAKFPLELSHHDNFLELSSHY